MRVTNQILQDTWLRDVQGRLGTIDTLNRQIGSGQRIDKPSDDPAGASRVVRIEEVVARNEQYLKNIDEALALNRDTDSALGEAYQRLVQAKSVALEGSNSASVAMGGSYGALASEVSGIKAGLLQIVNGTHEGKYLFSGTAENQPPFGSDGGAYRGDSNSLRVNLGNGQTAALNVSGDRAFRETETLGERPLPVDAAGNVTFSSPLVFEVSDGLKSVTVRVEVDAAASPPRGPYNPGALAAEIDGQLRAGGVNVQAGVADGGALRLSVADNGNGGEISLTDVSGEMSSVLGLSGGAKNVFSLLDDLQTALESQDESRVSGLLDRLDRALDGLGLQRGVVGSQGRNLEFTRNRIQAFNVTSEALKSEIEGVDTPRVVTKLSAEEQAYQTALAAGARILNVSLLDYLR